MFSSWLEKGLLGIREGKRGAIDHCKIQDHHQSEEPKRKKETQSEQLGGTVRRVKKKKTVEQPGKNTIPGDRGEKTGD